MAETAAVNVVEPLVETIRRRRRRKDTRPKRQPPYHVILWNDNDHTYAYVIVMMMELFGHPAEKGYQIAKEVDTQGRAVVITTTRERAELKRDQIHAYGKDGLIDNCQGSMWATIEAAEGE
jgi:ATP-dependent Clp protease adaptor protein ClpS